jgi:hypothetical protein
MLVAANASNDAVTAACVMPTGDHQLVIIKLVNLQPIHK